MNMAPKKKKQSEKTHALFSGAASIDLPSFVDSHCIGFTACGEISTDAILCVNDDEPLMLRYGSGRDAGFVNAFCRHNDSSFHLHMDVLSATEVKKHYADSWKNLNSNKKELEVFLSPFIGKKIAVHATGHFEIEMDELLESAPMNMLAGHTSGNVTFKPTGYSVTIDGERLKLDYFERDGILRANIDCQTQISISTSCLTDTLSLLDKLFNVFFIESASE